MSSSTPNDPAPEWDPHAVRKPESNIGKTLTLNKVAFDYFPQELIDLRIEISKHPDLLKLLHEQEDKDVYIQILEIAAYCKILVMGEYTKDDMLNLCKMLTEKLMSMRTIIVIPPTF